MPEILTESFCERCGTRYTFEAVAPKGRPLKKLKVLSKGLKNYVLSDEASLDEAFADARSDEQRAISSQQLDAFHKTFNFCMTCRQYTCANCWNQVEGRCLTCAPHLGQEILPGPFPVVDSLPSTVASENGNGRHPEDGTGHMIEASAWPTVDLRPVDAGPSVDAVDAVAEAVADAAPSGPPAAPDGETTAPRPAPEPSAPAPAPDEGPSHVDAAPTIAAAAAAQAAQPTADFSAADADADDRPSVGPRSAAAMAAGLIGGAAAAQAIEEASAGETPDDKAAIGAARTASLFARFRPGRDRSGQPGAAGPESEGVQPQAPIAAVAGGTAAAAGTGDVDAGDAEGLTPEEFAAISVSAVVAGHTRPPVTAPAGEPQVPAPAEAAEPTPEVAPEPEPSGAAPEPAAASEQPVPPRRDDVVETPTWRIVAPDSDAAAAAAVAPLARPAPSQSPQWPVQQGEPQWPTPQWSAAAAASRMPADAAVAQVPPTRAEALWAESSRDVLNRPGSGVQACVSCGLPLSATARFCRRCGSRQG